MDNDSRQRHPARTKRIKNKEIDFIDDYYDCRVFLNNKLLKKVYVVTYIKKITLDNNTWIEMDIKG